MLANTVFNGLWLLM